MLRNEFSSNLDITKSKFFPSASTMVGLQVATKPQSFTIALRKSEALILKLIDYALVDL